MSPKATKEKSGDGNNVKKDGRLTQLSDIYLEQMLLGAILISNDAFYRVSEFLSSEHFYEPLHKKLYGLIGDIILTGKLANPATVHAQLPIKEKVGEISVAQYLARLAAEVEPNLDLERIGRIIYNLAHRRSLVDIGEDIVSVAYDTPADLPPRISLEDAERKLLELAETGGYDRGFQSFDDAATHVIDMAGAAYQSRGNLSPILTGINIFDARLGGLRRSELVVLSGHSGAGKTSLATNIAFNIAHAYQPEQRADGSFRAANGGVVGFFSLGMSSEQLATRIIADKTGIPSSKIRRGEITEVDFEKLVACSQMMQKMPLYIDQTGGISIAQLAARARRLKRQRGLDVLIIDHLHLLLQSGLKKGRDKLELSRALRELKLIAKEMDTSVLVIFETHDITTHAYEIETRFLRSELHKNIIDFSAIISGSSTGVFEIELLNPDQPNLLETSSDTDADDTSSRMSFFDFDDERTKSLERMVVERSNTIKAEVQNVALETLGDKLYDLNDRFNEKLAGLESRFTKSIERR